MPRKKTEKKKSSAQPQPTPLVHPPFEELPPAIQAAIKAKGWTYPPDEALKQQWRESAERLKENLKDMSPEVIREAWLEIRGHEWDGDKKDV